MGPLIFTIVQMILLWNCPGVTLAVNLTLYILFLVLEIEISAVAFKNTNETTA